MEAGDSFVGKQATINLNQSSRTSPTSTVIESAARVSSPYAVAMVLMFYSNLRNATLVLSAFAPYGGPEPVLVERWHF
jgi:hypothetical protein